MWESSNTWEQHSMIERERVSPLLQSEHCKKLAFKVQLCANLDSLLDKIWGQNLKPRTKHKQLSGRVHCKGSCRSRQLSRMRLVLESFQQPSISWGSDESYAAVFSNDILFEMERRREGGRCMLQFGSSPFSAAAGMDNSAEYRSVIAPKVSSGIHSF